MDIVETLKGDYARFPVNQTYSIYANDVYFQDAVFKFRGIELYKWMIKFIQTVFLNLKLDLHKIQSQEEIINYNSNTMPTNNQSNTIIFDPIANFDRAKLLDPLVDPRGRSSADQIPTPIIAAQFNYPTQGILDRYHRVGLLIATDKYTHDYDNSDHNYSDKNYSKKSKSHKKSKCKINNNYHSSDNSSDNSSNYSDNSSNSSNSSLYPKAYKGVEFASTSGETHSIEAFENITTEIHNNYIYTESSDNDILELIGKKITDNWFKYFTSISKGNKLIKINIHNRNRRELYSGDEIYIPELHRKYRVKIDHLDQIEYNPYFF
jgi:hypothetical protein